MARSSTVLAKVLASSAVNKNIAEKRRTKRKIYAEKIYYLFRYSLITSDELCGLSEILSALRVKKTAEDRRQRENSRRENLSFFPLFYNYFRRTLRYCRNS